MTWWSDRAFDKPTSGQLWQDCRLGAQGASAPEILVQEVVAYLQGKGYGSVEEVEVMPENVRFGLPPEIVQAIAAAPPPAASL